MGGELSTLPCSASSNGMMMIMALDAERIPLAFSGNRIGIRYVSGAIASTLTFASSNNQAYSDKILQF
jgi:hypothetical protein